MASFRVHLGVASVLAVGYGAAGIWRWNYDWGDAGVAAGLATVGGLLPDLDSKDSVPSRELFGIAAVVGALLAYAWLRHPFDHEQAIVLTAGVYFLIRYGLKQVFAWVTVHRGMWHSVPAVCIAGLGVYLLLPGRDADLRYFFAGAVMLGCLTHLVLDELYSVDLTGKALLKKSAGTAVKLFSKSVLANVVCYGLLAGLIWVAYKEADLMPTAPPPAVRKPTLRGPAPLPMPQPQPSGGTPRWDQPRVAPGNP
jgi:hypothetical protein